MKLTRVGARRPDAWLKDLEVGEFFKRSETDDAPLYQRVTTSHQEGYNAIIQPFGNSVKLDHGDAVYRVNVDATWDWAK